MGSRAKKTGHAVEQDRLDVARQRENWFDGQNGLEPKRLLFIDETWIATNMTRSHGRCRKGERLRMGFPHGHRKTTTLVAGLRMTGMVAPIVLDGPINGDWFEAYVAQVLVPELRPGDAIIMDNLSSHKRAAVKERVEAAGADTPLPSTVQPGLQSDREGLLPAQGNAPQSGRANRQRVVGPDRQARRHLPARRMCQLLQIMLL